MPGTLTNRDVQRHIQEIVYPIFRDLGFKKLTPTKVLRLDGENTRCPDRCWAFFLMRFSSYDQTVMRIPSFTMQVQFLMMYPCLDVEALVNDQTNKKGEYAPKPRVNLARHFVHLQHPCPPDCPACRGTKSSVAHSSSHLWRMDEQTEPFSRHCITDTAEKMAEQIVLVVHETENVDTELQYIRERVPTSYEKALAFSDEFNSPAFHCIALERAERPRPWQRTQEPYGFSQARRQHQSPSVHKDRSIAAGVIRGAVSELEFASALARHFGRDAAADELYERTEAIRSESGLWG